MDLQQATAWLDRHINLEAAPRAGVVDGLSLDRMRALVHAFGDPQEAYPVVHVTGTNGKGSTARLISSLLEASGLVVGTYSSPHLISITERLAVQSQPIPDDEFGELIGDLAGVVGLLAEVPSYFELLTGAALRWFADVAVDVAVVEVGMLGRYDATNVCDGLVAVLTNVGHDHADLSRPDWREQVAGEKSGIVKPGSTFVCGETRPELRPIFDATPAVEHWYRGEQWSVAADRLAVGGRLIDVVTPFGRHDDVFVSLRGSHQAVNAATAMAAVEGFFGRALSEEVVEQALGSVTVPGRLETVARNPTVLLDGAHNLEGAQALAAALDSDFGGAGARIFVVGMLSPKDPRQLLEAMGAARAELVIACQPDWPRAIPAEEVADAARSLGAAVETVTGVADAVDRAQTVAEDGDLVVVTGSLYVVGAARAALL